VLLRFNRDNHTNWIHLKMVKLGVNIGIWLKLDSEGESNPNSRCFNVLLLKNTYCRIL